MIERITISDERVVMTGDQYNKIREIYERFFFRLPSELKKTIDKLILEIKYRFIPSHEHRYRKQFTNSTEAQKFIKDFRKDIKEEQTKIASKLEELESYSRSLKGRLRYLLVWKFN